jgi:hypothetical protein
MGDVDRYRAVPQQNEGNNMEDRRAHSRKPVYFRVDFLNEQGQLSMGLVKNLSLGGMFVEQTPGLALGEILTTAFALPDGQPFKTKAEVVRVDPSGFGIKFVDLSERYPADYLHGLEAFCDA